MGWFETVLTHVETQLRLLVEGDAIQDGFPRKLHHFLERELIHAMRAGIKTTGNESSPTASNCIAPDQYTVVLPPIYAEMLLAHPSELNRLTGILEDAARQAGLVFTIPPRLSVIGEPSSTVTSIQASFSQPGDGMTHTHPLEGEIDHTKSVSIGQLPKAFLIVNGLSTFPITMPIVNIGRGPSNQLSLADAHISDHHAQLRLVQGQFVIFFSDAREGNYVNGIPVSRHTLKAGDVISISGIPLVYGQEAVIPAAQTQELPVDPPSPEVL